MEKLVGYDLPKAVRRLGLVFPCSFSRIATFTAQVMCLTGSLPPVRYDKSMRFIAGTRVEMAFASHTRFLAGWGSSMSQRRADLISAQAVSCNLLGDGHAGNC